MNELDIGFKVILEAPSGAGKTHSLGTLADCGLETFVLFVDESSGPGTLRSYYVDKGLPVPDNLHLHSLQSRKASFLDLKDSAKKMNTLSHKTLLELTDPTRSKYDLYLNILDVCNNFIDQRTGEAFGSVDSWGPDRVFAVDGLTGINRAAMQLVIGGKAVRSQSDWGSAQFYVEELLQSFCNGCKCHFVLIAHQELETVDGAAKKTVATLGKALAPKIPQIFSDVVLAVRNGDRYLWSTADTQTDLKHRNLPLSSTLPPDFGPVYEKWLSRVRESKENR